MNDEPGKTEETPKAEAAPAAAKTPPVDPLSRLQAIEAEGRSMLADARQDISFMDKAVNQHHQNAVIAFDAFVYQFSLHLQAKKPK